MSKNTRAGYLNPSLYSSDDDDVKERGEGGLSSSDEDENMKKSPKITSTRPTRSSKRKSSPVTFAENKQFKKKKKAEYGNEAVSSDEESMPSEGNSDQSISSEELTEDNISDSDYVPDSEEEKNCTINVSSGGETPNKMEGKQKIAKSVEESEDFWLQVEKMRSNGFSIHQKNEQQFKNLQAKPYSAATSILKSSPAEPQMSKAAVFAQLCINFEHEKRCKKKCFMMESNQRHILAEINDPSIINHEFVKACIGVITCCIRLADLKLAREAIKLVTRIGEIRGVSTVCQAIISGIGVHGDTVDKMVRLEENAIDAFRNKQFNKALHFLDKVMIHGTGCIRLKMARGDCLAHQGKFIDAAKEAIAISKLENNHVGALFLEGFCHYYMNNMAKAIDNFQQVLEHSNNHHRAKILINKAKLFRDKKDLVIKAVRKVRLEDAEKILTEAIVIDPKNKEVTAELFADRADLYYRMKRLDECVKDCDAAILLYQSCSPAQLLRAKCHTENKEWGEAVKIYERMNNKDRLDQQNKKKAGDEALKVNNHDEAFKYYSEAQAVDRHNAKYRHLLREAKQQHMLLTRVDYYAVLAIDKTVGESDIKKAYFKKSKEYHPDRHANAEDEMKEEFSTKFKLAKEAYEVLSDMEKRKIYDIGLVKPPPGGWYRDLDKRIFRGLKPRGGGMVRGQLGGVSIRGGRGIPLPRGVDVVRTTVKGPSMARGRGVEALRSRGRGGKCTARGVGRGVQRQEVPVVPTIQKNTRARNMQK